MRRGKITNRSLILIVIVAFFTIMSYLFDQLVINSEDKLRNTKVLYENKKNELVANITFAETLSTISKGIDINIGQYLFFYSLIRFFIECFRGDKVRGIYFGISSSQIISGLIILITLAVILKKKKFYSFFFGP